MDKQKENFERLVRSHKDTIYTVCYMFSKDEDEVADLFQETLINVWRGLPKYQGGRRSLAWMDIPRGAQHLYFARSQQATPQDRAADNGRQLLRPAGGASAASGPTS